MLTSKRKPVTATLFFNIKILRSIKVKQTDELCQCFTYLFILYARERSVNNKDFAKELDGGITPTLNKKTHSVKEIKSVRQ